MAEGEKHPYISGSGGLHQTVTHLRKTFPASGVTADTIRKLGFAPNNETYIINVLRYVGIVDDEGKKTEAAAKTFTQHADEPFKKAFAEMVKEAYHELFDVHGDGAWDLDLDSLTQFFRSTDQTSAVVGRRQATTFQALSAIAGHAEPKKSPAKKSGDAKPPKPKAKAKPEKKAEVLANEGDSNGDNGKGKGKRDVGLTVRVEINLPAEGTKETYDAIFKSIRENLIDGE